MLRTVLDIFVSYFDMECNVSKENLNFGGFTLHFDFQMSSPTQYFWYRETLDISTDINTPQSFNLQIGGALFAAWVMIYLCLAKGIASSSKVRVLSFS